MDTLSLMPLNVRIIRRIFIVPANKMRMTPPAISKKRFSCRTTTLKITHEMHSEKFGANIH
jgi:hypothetical protein